MLESPLNCGDEVSIEGHIAVRHSRRVERKAGIAVPVEKNQSAMPVRTFRKHMDGLTRS